MTVISVPGRLVATVARTSAGEVRFRVRGDVDLAALDTLQPMLDEIVGSGAARLVVDLREVDFFDSSGLNLLLRVQIGAAAAGMEFELVSPSPAVERVLELTGAGALFAVREAAAPPDDAREPG